MLQAGEEYYLFAGDAVFDVEQVRDGVIAGISEVPDLARRSLGWIGEQLRRHPTFLLPAHDPASVARLERGEITRIPPRPER